MEMVTVLRMRYACELLINTGYMIKAIASFIGYGDAFSFSAAFKKHTGLSPRQFRNQNRKQRSKIEEVKLDFQKKSVMKGIKNV
jgi:AraC-like DNA-binding protein